MRTYDTIEQHTLAIRERHHLIGVVAILVLSGTSIILGYTNDTTRAALTCETNTNVSGFCCHCHHAYRKSHDGDKQFFHIRILIIVTLIDNIG